MHARCLPTLLLILALAPLAQAGSPDSPEIVDAQDDGGLAQLDIRKLWVDKDDPLNLTFHLLVGGDLPSVPTTSRCEASNCTFTSLTYRILFRVTDRSGAPLPQVADYNRSYVAYRHGPNGTLVSPVGTYDDENAFTAHGSANVTVEGSEIVLRIARSNAAVNMPTGPTPGSIVDRLYAYDSPQACTPDGCEPVPKPTVAAPPTGGIVLVNDWDRAPNQGYANATAFPAPPPPASPAAPAPPAPKPTASPAPTAPAPPAAPDPQPSETRRIDQTAEVSTTSSGPGKQSPPPAAPLLALALAALAAMTRRSR